MSTRAVYTFKDTDGEKFAVYKHHDGYPSGAAEFIDKAREFAWRGTRFEAAEFAAAFVAANKEPGGGGVYLSKGYQAHCDLDYDYEITSPRGVLTVTAYKREWIEETQIIKRVKFFKGSLSSFINEYMAKEIA